MFLNFRYEEIGADNFEKLVVQICKQLFGIGVQGFSPGKDGGRDAKFHGVAQLFPSKAAPWSGITIFQAKFTAGYNTTFRDPDFYKENKVSCTINKEFDKVKKLYEAGELNNYMLFANRRLGGLAEEKIRQDIHKNTGVPYENIFLAGIEFIEEMLQDFPLIPERVNLKPSNLPINIDPTALSEFIEHLHQDFDTLAEQFSALEIEDQPVKRTKYVEKNRLNNFSEDLANHLLQKHLGYTYVIDQFLQNPANNKIRKKYTNLVEDFQIKILAKLKHYEYFDDLYNHLLDLIQSRSKFLKQEEFRPLIHIVIFYMYWNCDIGVVE